VSHESTIAIVAGRPVRADEVRDTGAYGSLAGRVVGYRVHARECPACEVPGPIAAYRKSDGDLYCKECGFHIGGLPKYQR